MTGTIKTLLRDKRCGFITGDDERDYFFHQSALKNVDYDDLEKGQEVEFPDVGHACDCGKKRWSVPIVVAREHVWEFMMNGSFCRRCGAPIGTRDPCR